MSGKTKQNGPVKFILLPAVLYFLLDTPARLSGFMNLPGFAGPKNFLPATLGLLLGPWSAAGMCLGAAASSLLAGDSLKDYSAEAFGIIVISVLFWILWYVRASRPFCLKKGRDYLRFTAIAALLSAVSGFPGQLLLGGVTWMETMFSYFSFTLFVGVPVLILVTSVFCLHPVCPAAKETEPDIEAVIGADASNLEETNEKIGDFYTAHRMPFRQSFATQNCLEEFVVRIQGGTGGAPVTVRMYIRDSVSLEIAYLADRYNPLQRQNGETEEDLLGLLLIRQHALRASYSHSGRENHLYIVI
ncbi:MAG: hypothetical protein LKJ76_04610 [Lachnospiraceae bacterium]|jgi:hypothetical protein|nr:hypothetical protein [Lachnospiraceae bacterium]